MSVVFKEDKRMNKHVENMLYLYPGAIPIEKIWDPFNDFQWWYAIPGFPNYEISDYGFVRSIRNIKSHPFGCLMRYDSDNEFPHLNSYNIYEVSDSDHRRWKKHAFEFMELVKSERYPQMPRRTNFKEDLTKAKKNKTVKNSLYGMSSNENKEQMSYFNNIANVEHKFPKQLIKPIIFISKEENNNGDT